MAKTAEKLKNERFNFQFLMWQGLEGLAKPVRAPAENFFACKFF